MVRTLNKPENIPLISYAERKHTFERNPGSMARNRTKQQQQPIPHWLWAALPILAAPVVWYLGYPAMPLLTLAILLGGSTIRYPQSPTGLKKDPPSEKAMNRYRKWKDMLAGLLPHKEWAQPWRASWWAAPTLACILSLNASNPFTTPVNILLSYPTVMAWCRYRDRRIDRRHPYTGVSIPSFLTKAPTWKRVLALSATGVLLVVASILAWLELVSPLTIPAIPASCLILLSCLLDRGRQTSQWRTTVEYQKLLDKWAEDPDTGLGKPWMDVYLSQASRLGDKDNPLIVLRVKPKGGTERCRKLGVTAIQHCADDDGYGFSALLECRKRGGDQFDPGALRIILGKDQSCIPDITGCDTDVKLATLVFDIAYARTAIIWGKRAPLTKVTDVADHDNGNGKAAWLVELTLPDTGGELMDNISLNWLGNEPNPSTMTKLPVFADLMNLWHLYAQEDTPLSDAGNRKRPDGIITRSKPFADYVGMSRRYKSIQSTWQDIIGNKLNPPKPDLDQERTDDCDGWNVTTLPMEIDETAHVSDYAGFDLTPLDPQAIFTGIIQDGPRLVFVAGHGAAPQRVDQIQGHTPAQVRYAQAMIYHALVRALPAKGTVDITFCSQEGRDTAIWRVNIALGNGATVADMRRKTANIKSDAGSEQVFWDWKNASEATVWLCREVLVDTGEIRRWRRPIMQKRFIELVLSDSWGEAGVADKSGMTPKVRDMGVLQSNERMLKVRFEIPAGISIDRPAANIGKFLTAANYQYGRILPSKPDARLYDMVLAPSDPFPTLVQADWKFAAGCDRRIYPIGVDDMGEPVYWDTRTTPHLLITGKSGSGKSSASQILIKEALDRGEGIILIDPSKGCIDFTQWARSKAMAFVGLYQLRETEAVITWVRKEMAERVRLNNKYGVGDIFEIDPDQVEENERRHLQPINVLFDEFNSYLQETGSLTQNPNRDMQIANDNAAISATNASIARTMSELSKIIVQGRTAGIRMIFGAQRLTMDDLRKYNGNAFFRSLGRVLLGMDSPSGVVSVANLHEANRLQNSMKNADGMIPVGRGIYESMQGTLTSVQTWFSGGQSKLAQLVADVPEPEPIDYSRYMPKAAEQFTELRAEDLSTILSDGDSQKEEPMEEEDW